MAKRLKPVEETLLGLEPNIFVEFISLSQHSPKVRAPSFGIRTYVGGSHFVFLVEVLRPVCGGAAALEEIFCIHSECALMALAGVCWNTSCMIAHSLAFST